MTALSDRLAALIPAKREEVRSLLRESGERTLAEVTVRQAYGGLAGVRCLVTETSALDPQEGVRYRGYSIPEVLRLLPRGPGAGQPLPEGVFSLLLTGEIPRPDEVAEITAAWRENERLPDHVRRTLDGLPPETHPMTQLSIGVLAMQTESIFARRLRAGLARDARWEAVLDDAMVLLGRLPSLAAYIYRRTYKHGRHVEASGPGLDWAANLGHMLLDGQDPAFQALLRLYLTILADHEGGNISAHATHLVGSGLADPYLSLAAGLNGLAGPLHGLANQEATRFVLALREASGGSVPTREQIARHVRQMLREGRVVPGFGHRVLRATDPRYLAQREFALAHLADDDNVKVVALLHEIVPDLLLEHGRARNPWPNVDAHTGCLLLHYGLCEFEFHTVLFGVSRALGLLASLVWDRALGLPPEWPQSVTTGWIARTVGGQPRAPSGGSASSSDLTRPA